MVTRQSALTHRKTRRPPPKYREGKGVARVLLADDNPTSRLTLQTVLEAGGYRVDTAASAAEALGLLDQSEYALVLTNLALESADAGLRVLAHARSASYQPATAIVTASHAAGPAGQAGMLIQPQNLPELLGQVAGLIGERASRRVARSLRHVS